MRPLNSKLLPRFFNALLLSTMLVICLGLTTAAQELYQEPAKKIIKFGWDDPTPDYLEKNIEMIEQHLPYDGTGIDVSFSTVLPNGKGFKTDNNYFSAVKFDRGWFEPMLASLQRTKFKKLKHNFLKVGAAHFAGDFDLFDDKFFESSCANFATMAWLAKQGGCKGLCFDMEDYGMYKLWDYGNYRGRKSYRETWDKARERGRQWMNAVAKEYPDITIFCFFWLDLAMGAADGAPNLHERLEASGSGLLVAFINGIYDAMPPGAKIVNGMESQGYSAVNESSYMNMLAMRAKRFQRMIAPENQRKFREQTSLAAATYLDAYIKEKGSYSMGKYWKAENMTAIDFLRRNLTLAVNYSDEYAWTWSESRKWYPVRFAYGWMNNSQKSHPSVPGPYWGLALPGIEEAINFARNPYNYAIQAVKAGKTGKNLLLNPNFEASASQKDAVAAAPDSVKIKDLPNWETWQPKTSKGKFFVAAGEGVGGSTALKTSGVKSGVIHQGVKLRPGAFYLIRGMAKTTANSSATIGVQWRNEQGVWHKLSWRQSVPFTEDMGGGWKRGTLLTQSIPEGSGYMSIMLGVTGNDNPEESVWFDNIQVFDLFATAPEVAPHLKSAQTAAKQEATAKKSQQTPGNLVVNGTFNTKSPVAKDGVTLNGTPLYEVNFQRWRKNKETTQVYRVVAPKAGFSDDTAGMMQGGDGTIMFSVFKIKAGEKYRVSAKTRIEGAGKTELLVYWTTKGQKGPFNLKKGVPKFKFDTELQNGWKQAEGVITVPDGVDHFTVLVAITGQKTAADKCFVDDVEAYKLNP